MKRNLVFIALMAFIVLFDGAVRADLIVDSKHNLSGGGPGTYKAISSDPIQGGTSEICIFCHTPHSGNTEAPLWNRAISSGQSYQTYTSDVLGALGYPSAEDPRTGVAHSKTRICLSCHDGTIALGSVMNMPNDIAKPFTQIQMSGGSNIVSSASGYIGLDLRDDHPVAIKHDSTLDSNGLKPGSSLLYVRLYKDGGAGKAIVQNADGNYIECTSCHNPHDNRWKKFLIANNLGSALCIECHRNDNIGSGSPAHDSTAANLIPYDPDGAGTIGTTVGEVKCLNCHYSHKAGVNSASPSDPLATPGPYLLSFQGDETCFNTRNRWGNTTSACHGSNGTTRDIATEQNKSSAHKYASGVGKHRALEANIYGWLGSGNTNWHVDCSDCHNSHTAGRTKHTAGSGGLTANAIGSSSPLYGAGGVSISWPIGIIWPTLNSGNFTPFESLGLTSSTSMNPPIGYFEYQICLKCHSSFAWGDLGTPPGSPTLLNAPMTDQAKEFSPYNTANNGASMHPVAGPTGNTLWGTPNAPWLANRGSQTMYCSDCHNTDGVNAQGPHGSGLITNKAILPVAYANTYAPVGTNQPQLDFCFTCHSELVYQSGGSGQGGTGFSGGGVNLHTQHRIHSSGSGTSNFGYRCVNCHTRVPHGYNRKAMIVLRFEGAPYETGGTGAGKIQSIVGGLLPASNAYQSGLGNKDANCTTVAGCHQ